jgi:eukaryotic-like serine/threonine-protein kinase
MGDRYTITERVDQGGMAEVFRGVAESLQGFKKSVAIKRILPNLTKNKKFVSMFLDEARLSLHLQHANIVHVFDIGIADTAYFIVMEYVDGANLKALIDFFKKSNRAIPVPYTLYILLEVCKGLAYAHDAQDPENGKQLGIVHRDISPPNILVSRMGEVKLVDFGLAKATSQIETTDPGVVKGKFSYLSPEAASGIEVDHRADIFAVGILLWEMLTGRRLFYGETDYQTVELVRQARIPSIQALNPEVSNELESVARKALARDPKDRFQQAADMQEALAQVLFSRGMKVTSRDIANVVRETVADREAGKTRVTGPQKSLIDTLIQEEMLKFTSLDAAVGEPSNAGAQPLSPEQVGGGGQPLDAGSFVDTRDWADESSAPTTVDSSLPISMDSTLPLDESSPPITLPRRTSAGKVNVPPTGDGVDSLQDFLEPDRTNVGKRPGTATAKASRFPIMTALIVVIILGLLGGGLFLFKDKLFGP